MPDRVSRDSLVAVLSDIHANAPALRAVLADAQDAGARAFACLGDIVGYHAFPAETLRLLRSVGAVSVCGNHDRMVADPRYPVTGGSTALEAVAWTRTVLDDDGRRLLSWLPMRRSLGEGTLATHATPWSLEERLTTPADFAAAAERLRRTFTGVTRCFSGHTHVASAVRVAPDGGVCLFAGETVTLDASGLWFVNPGSVGLPRDGRDGAAYVLFDRAAAVVTFRRVPYDVRPVNRANRRAGLGTQLPAPTPASGIARRVRRAVAAVRARWS